MKVRSLLSCAALIAVFGASSALQVDFASGIPRDFTIENVDGAPWQDKIYNHLGQDNKAAWVAGQLPDHGRAALSPTRRDPLTPVCHRMALPPVAVAPGDILRWQARSVHPHLVESYIIEARVEGDDQWQTIYSCDAESLSWATRILPLESFAGRSVTLAFTATTAGGFMLAVDNVYVGQPAETVWEFAPDAPHFVEAGVPFSVGGVLACHGGATDWTSVSLEYVWGDEHVAVETHPIETLATGQCAEVVYTITPDDGETVQYAITAYDAEGRATTLHSDFYCSSRYHSEGFVHVLDRCSGTWCNNCPVMELTTRRLQRYYGPQLFIVEAHVNDNLADQRYWDGYLAGFCYSVPCLVPDRDPALLVNTLAATDYMQAALATPAQARVDVSAMVAGSEVRVDATVAMGNADNSDDRYRLAYMLTADLHDPANPWYFQQNSASTFYTDCYYYQPSTIMAEMMYFDNVPVETSAAMGVPMSLPTVIRADVPAVHTMSLPLPAERQGLTLLAMVVDTSTGRIVTASRAAVGDDSGISDVDCDMGADSIEYDLLGRPVDADTPGWHISAKAKTYKAR